MKGVFGARRKSDFDNGENTSGYWWGQWLQLCTLDLCRAFGDFQEKLP